MGKEEGDKEDAAAEAKDDEADEADDDEVDDNDDDVEEDLTGEGLESRRGG